MNKLNPLYGDDHEETCPCREWPAVNDDQLSECECADERFIEKKGLCPTCEKEEISLNSISCYRCYNDFYDGIEKMHGVRDY